MRQVTFLMVGIAVAMLIASAGCNSATNASSYSMADNGSSPSTAERSGEKAKKHRFDKLRAGAVKTDNGWNVQDWAISMFNPNSEPITVTLKMVSDDPEFVYTDKQVGTYTKSYQIGPMQGATDNVYCCEGLFPGADGWPVASKTNFTGSAEYSCSKPFYCYLLPETRMGEAATEGDAYTAAWVPWQDDDVPAGWDEDLKQFVIPYTNFWQHETRWRVGWHSILTIKNNTDAPVQYTIRHIPYYGGFYNPKDGQITKYKEEVVYLLLQKRGEKKITLMDLYDWPTDQMTAMEGCLLISPNTLDPKGGTAVTFSVIPNEIGRPLHAGPL